MKMPQPLALQAFLKQAGDTLNTTPTLLAFNIPAAPQRLTPALLCEQLAQKITQGELALELLYDEEISETYNPYRHALTAEALAPVPCAADWLLSIAIPYAGLGAFLTNLLAGQKPFSAEFYQAHLATHPDHHLPYYFSFYHHQASLAAAQALAQDCLQTLDMPFDSEFLLLAPPAFEAHILAPILRVYAEFQHFFDNLGNDSVLVFGNTKKLYVLLTAGTD